MLGEVLYDLYDRMLFWLQGVTSDTSSVPMTGNQATVTFSNGMTMTLNRIPAITFSYDRLIEEYTHMLDSLADLVTPPHISSIVIETHPRDYGSEVRFTWNFYHSLGRRAVKDIAYKIVPSFFSPNMFPYLSTGRPDTILGFHRNFYSQYFFQRRNETSRSYRFYLRIRSGLGFSQTRFVPFTVGFRTPENRHMRSQTFTLQRDNTPPVMLSLSLPGLSRKVIGPHRMSVEFYSSSTTGIYAEWSGEDPESDIEEYQYMLEHLYTSWRFDPTTHRMRIVLASDTIIHWTSAHGLTRYTIRGLSLEHTETYRLSVRAKNGARLYSEPIYRLIRIDTTAPPPPSPYSGYYVTPPLRYLNPPIPPRIFLRYTVNDDPESQVKHLIYKVDTIPHYHFEGTGWDTIPKSQTSIDIIGVPIHYLDTFYISIVAENIVGLVSDPAFVSPPLVPHDPTPPEDFSFEPYSRVYGRFIQASDTLLIRLTRPSYDPETGIKHYVFGIDRSGGRPEFYRLITPEELETTTVVPVVFDTTKISDGQRIYLYMKAMNREGLEKIEMYGPLFVEKTPPPEPIVMGVEYRNRELTIAFKYRNDPQSGIQAVGYEITDNKGQIIREFTPLRGVSPGENVVTVTTVPLPPGDYIVTVVVRNRAYLESCASHTLEVR